jgi:hypothetical protein
MFLPSGRRFSQFFITPSTLVNGSLADLKTESA